MTNKKYEVSDKTANCISKLLLEYFYSSETHHFKKYRVRYETMCSFENISQIGEKML